MPPREQQPVRAAATSRFLLAMLMAIVPIAPSQAAAQTPTPTAAPSKGERALEDVEQRLLIKRDESEILKTRAAQLKAELKSLNDQLVAAATRVQGQEAQLNAVEESISRLSREMEAKESRLNERRDQFAGVVMALTRMSRVPTEALIVQPMAPNDMVRSAILLKAAVPSLEGQAMALRAELDALIEARAEVESQKMHMAYIGEQHIQEQQKLETLVKRKTALRAEAISKSRAAASEMHDLAKKANTLRELLGRIEDSRSAQGGRSADDTPARAVQKLATAPSLEDGVVASITRARGNLPFPVVGQLVGRYGEVLAQGTSRKGLSLATRPGAQVVAPFDGKVVFSGPFRGYGQLLIIDHGEGYHSLLAGLGRIDAALGSPVLAGEPVAIMSVAGDEAPVLYVEFRHDNEPVNPLPWLAAQNGNVSG